MDQSKLIMTSIKGWPHEQWLQWRKPMFHVMKFISEFSGKPGQSFLIPGKDNYDYLFALFQTKEWEEFIFPCIGGSEMGHMMVSNKWKSKIELYYEKVGIVNKPDIDNEAMFWGRELEEHVAEKWQYWEGDIASYFENYKSKKIVRKCRKVNFYIQGSATPWIFVSLDRIINKAGEVKEKALECKTINGRYADMWEAGIPMEYIIQMQTQLLSTCLDDAELAILIDGRKFQVYPFERSEGIIEAINKESYEFFLSVKRGIQNFLLQIACPDDQQAKLHGAAIDGFAPDIDGSIAAENYLKERFIDRGGERLGNGIELELAKEYDRCRKAISALEDEQRFAANKLREKMGGVSRLNFRTGESVSWRKDSRNVRVLRVDTNKNLFS